MSSEFDDIDAGLQRDLQPDAPTAPHGALDGRSEPPAADYSPEPPDAPVGQPGAPSAPSAAVQAALIGEPGTLPPTWCKVCQAEVKPEGKGRCPRCNAFLKLNFAARRHPINRLRRDQLHDEIVAEYRPRTLEQRDACRYLANVKERLDTAKDGTPEHQRLMAMWSELSVQLRAASGALHSASAIDLSKLTPQQQADRAEALAVRLRAIADRQAASTAYLAHVVADRAAGLPSEAAAEPKGEAAEPTPVPAPATCTYCGALASGCATIRQGDPEWMSWHAAREDVVALLERQRQTRLRLGHETHGGGGIQREGGGISSGASSPADPTAEMLRQIGKPLPDWYR